MRISDWSSDVCSSDLGLTLTNELAETYRSRLRIIVIVSALALLLPIGALAAVPVATLSPVMVAGFLSFGLMALLYLVTEELLVEAHEKPDTPLISSMFFVGRSEEHTSELQSLMRISYAVFCLKKKINQTDRTPSELPRIISHAKQVIKQTRHNYRQH